MSRCPEHGCNGRMKFMTCLSCGFHAYRIRPGLHSGFGANGQGDPWAGQGKDQVEYVEITQVVLGEEQVASVRID